MKIPVAAQREKIGAACPIVQNGFGFAFVGNEIGSRLFAVDVQMRERGVIRKRKVHEISSFSRYIGYFHYNIFAKKINSKMLPECAETQRIFAKKSKNM